MSQPPGPPPVPPSEPPPGGPPPWVPAGPYQPAHGPVPQPPWWKRRIIQLIIGGAVAVIAVVVILVTVVLAPSGPLTVTGTISSTVISGLGGQSPDLCDLNLPTSGDQLLMKADGVTVATAQLSSGIKTVKSSIGASCSESFTFADVPAGHNLYEVTIGVSQTGPFGSSYGCSGTVYYKPAQLSKPLALSCS